MALEALGRRDEALTALKAVPTASLTPVFASIRDGPAGALRGYAGRRRRLRRRRRPRTPTPRPSSCTRRSRPHFGDPERALARLTEAVDGGFTVPQALREHPWLSPLRSAPAFAGLVERAEARRSQALVAFRDAGGETLLGAL